MKSHLQLTGVAYRVSEGENDSPLQVHGLKHKRGNLKCRIFCFTISWHRTTTTTTKAERLNFTRWLKQFSACRLINDTADLVYSYVTWYCIVYRYYFLLTYEFANPIRARKGVCCSVFCFSWDHGMRNWIIFGCVCVRLCVCLLRVFFFLSWTLTPGSPRSPTNGERLPRFPSFFPVRWNTADRLPYHYHIISITLRQHSLARCLQMCYQLIERFNPQPAQCLPPPPPPPPCTCEVCFPSA